MKVEDFRCHFDPYEFLDCLESIEHFFKWKDLPEEKVKVVTLKLMEWREFQVCKVRQGKDMITSRVGMREKLRSTYHLITR